MKLHSLKNTPNSRQERKVVGRGIGSGTGKTSTRGHKGQGARKSGNVRIGFEGGQTPLFRRIPKKGFKNYGNFEYIIVNLDDLNKFSLPSNEVTLEILVNNGLLKSSKSKNLHFKVLGDGELTKPLNISAHKFSKTAIEKITKAGGKAIVLN